MKKYAHLFLWSVAVVVLFVGVFLFFNAHRMKTWKQDNSFGTIVRITEEGFVLADFNREAVSVRVGRETRLRAGPRVLDRALVPGDRVLVVGEADSQGVIEADLVRVVVVHSRESTPTPSPR